MTVDGPAPGSPLVPVHGSARGPSAVVVLVLVAAVLVGAVAVADLTAPKPAPGPSTVVLGSPTPAVSTVPSPVPSPTSPGVATTVLVLRDLADPAAALATLAGCSPLLRVTGQGSPVIRGSDVDAAAAAAGRETGWVFVPPGIQALTRVWLGDDVVGLALAAGRPVVAVGTTGDVWLGGPAGAARWDPIPTPAGRTAWALTQDEVTSRGRCGPWPVPQVIAGQRSLSCSGIGAMSCVRFVAKVEADTPGVLYPRGAMALANPPCPSAAASCGVDWLTVVAVPTAWSGTIVDVRAAAVSLPDEAFTLLAEGVAPEFALDALSPPSLPLLVGDAKAPPRACSTSLVGLVHAAPWDPRVFWVGATGVKWPAGTTARFADLPQLTVPTKDGSYRFVVGSAVRLQGSLDARAHTFVACSVQPPRSQS